MFEIDTPGGLVADAQRMAELIEEYRREAPEGAEPRFHAYVRHAISAGIWILFSCDDVYWAEDATAGAAVTFTQDRSTGAAQVDAKMNSAFASDVATLAGKRGHSPHLVWAMMVPEKSLHAWRSADGAPIISDTQPPNPRDAEGYRLLDTPGSILTLLVRDAVEIGFGRLVPAGPESLGAAARVVDWKSAGDEGVKAMERGAAVRQKEMARAGKQLEQAAEIAAEFDRTVKKIGRVITAANAADPLSQSYRVDSNGVFTGASRARWKANCNAALDLWEEALREIESAERLDGRFRGLTGEGLMSKVGKKWVVGEIREKVKWLKDKHSATRL